MPRAQRLVFGEALVELGGEDERIVVLDADVSTSTQTKHFAVEFPERFFNVGVAEANMVSIAAGLAACGYVPFVSTFAFLLALRAGDQVRAQVAYGRLNVKLMGGYAGLSDFADGASHQSVEDLAVMRALPNMTVIVPSDVTETRLAVRAAAAHEGPVYMRLSRAEVGEDYGPEHPFEIGRGIVLREGDDTTIIATGPMVRVAMEAADELAEEGLDARVIDMHTLKPIDKDIIVAAARETGGIVTVEEHSVYGGLGSAVCEVACEHCPVPVFRCGIPDRFGESGAYQEILRRAGLHHGRVAELGRTAVAARMW
jgi:transketolase